jgi:hypothetical protein
MSDKAKRTRNPAVEVLLTCCVSVQDTGGYERHIFTGPHPLPTRDERHSRENSKVQVDKVRFGCVSLLTEWLILGDRTEAADYTKL